jgi:hypothetical protein
MILLLSWLISMTGTPRKVFEAQGFSLLPSQQEGKHLSLRSLRLCGDHSVLHSPFESAEGLAHMVLNFASSHT